MWKLQDLLPKKNIHLMQKIKLQDLLVICIRVIFPERANQCQHHTIHLGHYCGISRNDGFHMDNQLMYCSMQRHLTCPRLRKYLFANSLLHTRWHNRRPFCNAPCHSQVIAPYSNIHTRQEISHVPLCHKNQIHMQPRCYRRNL